MIGRNSSMYYRRNGYRKRRIKNIIIIAVSILVALAVLFLIVGNLLNKKLEDDKNAENTKSSEMIQSDEKNAVSYSINAPSIDLKGISSDAFNTRINELDGATAVSLNLSDSNGNLLYSSQIAQRMGYQNASSSLIALSTIRSRTSARGIYTSAYLTIKSLSEKDIKMRAVMTAYEASIICEIAEAGIGDIVLRFPEISADNISDIVNLGKAINNLNSEAVVGVTFTTDVLKSENSTVYVEELLNVFDFATIDATAYGEFGANEYVEHTLADSNIRYYILRYNMRVLIPSTNDNESAEKIQSSLLENSIKNWQVIQ